MPQTIIPIVPAPLPNTAQTVRLTELPPLSLYIHVPWCIQKCPYCDFNSHALASNALPESAYIAALIADLESALPDIWGRPIHTIFFGGGTPSLLSPCAIDQLMSALRARLPINPFAEITLEANPGTVDAQHFKGFQAAGVNRLSLGIQSFNDEHLKALGRIHTAQQAHAAIESAMQTFERVNLDLMYALPQQTLTHMQADLDQALSYAPSHLSCYHLTLEPNTAFANNSPILPDEDSAADMQILLEQRLEQAGYAHYETSAFAKPGQMSRHNLNYWTFGDYLGIGAGAHSKISFPDKIVRSMRYKHPNAYLQNAAKGQFIQDSHLVETQARPFEFMMNALRLTQGVPSTLFAQRTGLPLNTLTPQLKEAQQKGLLSLKEGQLAPTKLGARFLNDLLTLFLDTTE